MYRVLALLCGFLVMGVTIAEPPPGHPSVDQAHDALQVPADERLLHQGQVLQSIASNDYVYLEVTREDGSTRWLAAPRAEIMPQSWIRYSDGVVIRNFFSRKHQRTFNEVMFVDRVQALGN